MDCCDNKNITCKDYENICINCGTIHDYQYVNEISFKDYNMNMLNILFYKKTIYMRKKYLYRKCLHIKEIKDNIILFFDNSLENIRKLYNMKKISISIYYYATPYTTTYTTSYSTPYGLYYSIYYTLYYSQYYPYTIPYNAP